MSPTLQERYDASLKTNRELLDENQRLEKLAGNEENTEERGDSKKNKVQGLVENQLKNTELIENEVEEESKDTQKAISRGKSELDHQN